MMSPLLHEHAINGLATFDSLRVNLTGSSILNSVLRAFLSTASVLAVTLVFLLHSATAAELPAYVPHQVALPTGATYWDHDAVTIVGYNDMDAIFAKLNALFVRYHPRFHFNMRLPGTAAAPAALAFGVSAFAPMGAEFSAHEAATFHAITGDAPEPFRVAHCSLDPRAKSAPIGIFVNAANPIASLTTLQVAQVFTTGQKPADITFWGQLGLPGEWSDVPIHPVGIAEEAAGGLSSFMLAKMHGLPFAPAFDGFPQSVDVIKKVSQDVAAIGFASGNSSETHVKLLKIEDRVIKDDNYAYDRFLLIYVRKRPDAFVAEYLRLIFSREGQAAIASAEPHYRPLLASEVTADLSKLDELGNAKPSLSGKLRDVNQPTKPLCIMGSRDFQSLLQQVDESFAAAYRGSRPVLKLQGTAAALEGLAAGLASVAICDRAAWPLELRPFRQLQGNEPLDIRIARIGYAAANSQLPVAVYVNAINPLAGLTLLRVRQIFVRGNAEGDITNWGQLGLTGAWGYRAIHIFGLRDNGGFATATRHAHFDSLPFSRAYEPFNEPGDAAKAAAQDPFGIVLLDRMGVNTLPPEIRLLPLASGHQSPYSAAAYDDVRNGKYPLSDYLHAYINRTAGNQPDSIIAEYVRFLLSPAGQQMIAAAKRMGMVALDAREIRLEFAKLNGHGARR